MEEWFGGLTSSLFGQATQSPRDGGSLTPEILEGRSSPGVTVNTGVGHDTKRNHKSSLSF